MPPSKMNITAVGVVKALDLEEQTEAEGEDEDEEGDEGDEKEEGEEDDDYNDEPSEAKDLILRERLQFKQLSVGEGFSCGIVLREDTSDQSDIVREGDLVCWGGDKKHGAMPHHIVGPYKQVRIFVRK